jgi:DNA repair exonuclease SbcCD nuclease subunit
MSGVVLYSDPHFSNRTAFGKFESNPTFPGCNSRFHEIAKTLVNALQYAKDNDCEAFFILGDVFHERGTIQVPVFKGVHDILFKGWRFPIYAIPGNHDMVDLRAMHGTKGLNSLFAFDGGEPDYERKSIIRIFDKESVVRTSFAFFNMLPFSVDEKKLINMTYSLSNKGKSTPNIFLMHHSFMGAITGPHEWAMPNHIDIDDFNQDVEMYWSGHYHRHQRIKGKTTNNELWYVGAPLQHDFGEKNYTPGFIHLLPDLTWKQVENVNSPRFNIIETSSLADLNMLCARPQDYISVKWKGDAGMIEKYKTTNTLPNMIIDTTPTASVVESRTDIKTTDSVEETISKYVEAKKGKEDKELADFGLTLYKKV